MLKLGLLLLLAACASNPWAGVNEWRYLFVRNASPDTAIVSLTSQHSDRVVVLRVAPHDSSCAKIPWFDADAYGTVQVGQEMAHFRRSVSRPGLDWMAVAGASLEQPAFASCLQFLSP